jgi:trehalose-6-phosphate synthase
MEPRPSLILANRSYLDHDRPRGAGEAASPASGGLIAAVRPIIAPWTGDSGTTWIGASRGEFDREFTDAEGFERIATPGGSLRHRRLFFDEATWQSHYALVSNSCFWPLLHLVREPLPLLADYYPAPVSPDSRAWSAYRAVNERFADAALGERPGGACWVHDYQLALVPDFLRRRGFAGRVGFFLHTPFPSLDVARPFLGDAGYGQLGEFVRGILGADLVGLQSVPDVARFREAAGELCGASPDGGGLRLEGRRIAVASYPVGIDANDVLAVSRTAVLPAAVAVLKKSGLPLVVGLDRADFTKGIPERLGAIARLYDSGERFAYAGVAAPTRAGVPAYQRLEAAMSEAAARAERAAGRAHMPFVQLQQVIAWPEVIAIQREADVVFTSSLADGMNLVPLQAAVAQSGRPPGERAVIIAGRDAGVSHALAGFEKDGLAPVDPLNPLAMEQTLRRALVGRPGRISDRLVDHVFRHDAASWATAFLSDLEAVRC